MGLYNKFGIELLYEELKGLDRAGYDSVRAKYEKDYKLTRSKTPFGTYWGKALALIRANHNPSFKRPPIRESSKQREDRLMTPNEPKKVAEMRARLHKWEKHLAENITPQRASENKWYGEYAKRTQVEN